ncbi:MAG: hypothetical protein KC457_05605, partial [Myxococcales bacterium]|nr:hypothetical protein [Myxococcales bacterium]
MAAQPEQPEPAAEPEPEQPEPDDPADEPAVVIPTLAVSATAAETDPAPSIPNLLAPKPALDIELSELPPPPTSAAFESHHEQPSYESGRFIAEDEPEPAPEPASESDQGFHIPALSLGAVAPEPPTPEP